MSIQNYAIQLMNEAVLLTIIMSMPAVLSSMFIGVMVAIFSATTQIQEQTLSFVPKMIAVFIVLAISGPWIGSTMIKFCTNAFNGIITVIH